VNDYEEIQKLYEEGYRGLSYNQGPNAKYDTSAAPRGYSYRKGGMPTGYPGAGGWSAYNAGLAGSYGVGTAVIVSGDEEGVHKKEILNTDVLEKIHQLQQEAEEEGMEYAILQLAKLKEHIIDLSQ
tara:strand:- start:596 stop:973 length:378 start_codon:yes stop_codon:yes gene_type:complete